MRVIRYMRPYDYALGAGVAALGPAGFLLMEKLSPSYASPASIRTTMRLMGVIGVTAGFLRAYTESSCTRSRPFSLLFLPSVGSGSDRAGGRQ